MKRSFRPSVECLEGRRLLALVTGMTLAPNPPRLGSMIGAGLTTGAPGPFSPASTAWKWDVTYSGFTSPWFSGGMATVLTYSIVRSTPGW